MEKDILLQSTEEQCCPVCQRPLSIPPSVKPNNATGKKLGRKHMQASDKQKAETELIVSAMCGHLFHKFCLRHYCYTYRQCGTGTNDTKVECPVCFQYVCMTKVQTIDYKAHRKVTAGYEKAYRHTLILNQELSDQKEEAFRRLNNIENCVAEADQKLQTYMGHVIKVVEKSEETNSLKVEKDKIYQEIEESTQEIDLMHKENMQLVTMYLSIMKDKTHEELKNKRVPAPLIPYLAIIQGNEKLMRKFGEILKPVELDGFRSNTEVLIQEILAHVRPIAADEQRKKDIKVANLPKHFQLQRDKANPVVVKVQRSSLSIFSRTTLTDQSLQQIMKQVKAPIKALKDAHKKQLNITSTVETVRESTSDMEVLFEPRKRQTQSDTAPRSLDDSDWEFGGKELIPLRKCRSTAPILMKNYIKGPKALIIKIDCLQQNEVTGDSKQDQEDKRSTELQLSSRGDINAEHVSFPTTPRVTSTAVNRNVNLAQNVQIREINGTPYPNELKSINSPNIPWHNQHLDADIRVKSSTGFGTTVKASVLELLLENIVEDKKSSTCLVDEVSRISFGNCATPNFHEDAIMYDDDSKITKMSEIPNRVIEYKIDTNGNIKPLVKDEVYIGKSNVMNSDIENGIKVGELTSQTHARIFTTNSDTMNQQDVEDTSGFLKGILPGPYRNISPRVSKPPQMYNACSKPNANLPVYLTKWVSKLPSARVGAAGYVTPIPPCPSLPPPPPVSNRAQRLAPSKLPPLPKTPLSLKISADPRIPATYENNEKIPYNSGKPNTNASHYEEGVVRCPSCQHTVINIPSSNACFHGHHSRKPNYAWSHDVNTRYSRTSLPPLPDESTQRERVYIVKAPDGLRQSQRLLTQSPPIHIVVKPRFSYANMTQPRSERRSEWTTPSHPLQSNEPYQLHLSPLSQERLMCNSNVPSDKRDLYSNEGYMQQNYDCFPNDRDRIDYVYRKKSGSVNYVESVLSGLCPELSPPVRTALPRTDSPILHHEGQYYSPCYGQQHYADNTKRFEESNRSDFCTNILQGQGSSIQPRVVRRARRRHNHNV